jgi:hypothetical protein
MQWPWPTLPSRVKAYESAERMVEMLKPIMGHKIVSIKIDVEREASDYYDCVVDVLKDMITKLDGGHYEPKSQRDCDLRDKIQALVDTLPTPTMKDKL